MVRETKFKKGLKGKGVTHDSTSHTATSDGTGTGTILGETSMVEVTSSNADYIVVLPSAVVGRRITIVHDDSVDCELRTSDPTNIALNNVTGAGKELVLTAGEWGIAQCIVGGASGKWTYTKFSNVGASAGGGTPD